MPDAYAYAAFPSSMNSFKLKSRICLQTFAHYAQVRSAIFVDDFEREVWDVLLHLLVVEEAANQALRIVHLSLAPTTQQRSNAAINTTAVRVALCLEP